VAMKLGGADQLPLRRTRKDFQRLAELRAREAASLAKTGRQQGAYYLGGFAVECALKACIAKKTRRHDFPADAKYAYKVYTHNLEELLKLAQLDSELDREMRSKPQLAINWAVVSGWNVDSRYETTGLNGRVMAAAVNSSDGVLQWIKLFW
jgi:HEPN domain-containing protein